MKAIVKEKDYTIVLDEDLQELQKLRQGKRLEANLMSDGKDSGKLVSLELAENDGKYGIKLRHMPDDAESWERVREVQVKVNKRAYRNIINSGHFGIKYDGLYEVEIWR